MRCMSLRAFRGHQRVTHICHVRVSGVWACSPGGGEAAGGVAEPQAAPVVVQLPLGGLAGRVRVLRGPGEGAAPRVEGAVVLPSNAERPSQFLHSDSLALQAPCSASVWLSDLAACLREKTAPVSTDKLQTSGFCSMLVTHSAAQTHSPSSQCLPLMETSAPAEA